jgi:hypothetical protein
MNPTRLAVLPFALVAATLAACSDTSSSAIAPTDALPDRGGAAAAHHGGLPDGEYEANLHPLNAAAQQSQDPDRADGARGVARGKATFTIRNGQVVAMVSAMGLEPAMIHPQHIHAATTCPPASADVNHDGYVDVIEGVPFYGPILIPLDSDIGSQAAGTFPTASGVRGIFEYAAATPLATMLADLNAVDPNPTDAVIKLNGAPLALENRHVVLHGVDAATALPSSVASLPGLPAYLTLPVACGEIRRVR